MTAAPHKYIALVRGINVGGHGIIKMAEVRKIFEGLGFEGVQTYIQSGNVLFDSKEMDQEKLARMIEQKFEASMGRKISVFVLSPAELKRAAVRNPFEPERLKEEQLCHLLFLSAKPKAEGQKAVMALQGREYRFHIHDKILYYAYAKKFAGNRRMINFEKVLGIVGTARAWNVINKLIELADM